MILSVAIYAFTLTFVALPTPVLAQLAQPIHPKDQARIIGVTAFLRQCAIDNEWHNNRDEGQLNAGDVFAGNKPNDNVGYYVDANDARLYCSSQSDMRDVYASLGITGMQIWTGDGSTGIYGPTATGYQINNGISGGQARANAITDYVKRLYPSLTIDSLNDAQKYYAAQATFDRECRGDAAPAGAPDSVVTVSDVNDANGDISQARVFINSESSRHDAGYYYTVSQTCRQLADAMNQYAAAASGTVKDFVAQGGSGPIATPGADDTTKSCEENLDFALSWMVCGILEVIDDAFRWLNDAVVSLLTINAEEYNNDSLRTAWSYFRNLASFLLLIIGLVMIIGQAIGKD